MKLAALGGRSAAQTSPDVARFMRRASLRRGFGFLEHELDRLSPREARWFEAFLQGLDDAAVEQKRQAAR